MIYFTSDWHLGEERIGINGKPNLFYRPFKSISEQNDVIMNNFYNVFKDGDTLYHLGDVVNGNLDNAERRLKEMKLTYPNSKFILIQGNYDEGKDDMLSRYFEIKEDLVLNVKGIGKCYLNHYPTKTIKGLGLNNLGITGHIHSLWKVQKNLINVGVDAWNFRIVSEEELSFCYNAMNKFYDKDVFPYCS
ncbi:metallophosphoesterase [Tenacibaculum dicentrarchi]|uniref:metallophosphoesterase n=1 Tax=Tenacibaculum dicentrarchi TaxID=669041 RepID=UPI0035140DCB